MKYIEAIQQTEEQKIFSSEICLLKQNPIKGKLRFFYKKYYNWLKLRFPKWIKRSLDILVSTSMLLLLWPIFLVVAILIKITDTGPILFWQKRVGLYGKEFDFPKFRSMHHNAEKMLDHLLSKNDHHESITFKMKNDPRVTWIGRILRKTSIDELPQLWCVLKGEMSLVGPRPPIPKEVKKYSLSSRRRLNTTPGLTCIWQISGRGDIPFDKQVEMDIQYIENQSLWLDFKIILKTIPIVLIGKGAY